MAVRVVVGEDEPLVREGIVRVLERAGFEVVGVAGDAPELLRKTGAHKPDVVITDIEMPPDRTDDGLRAAIEIRRTRPGTGVVVLSQFLEDRYPLELVGERADGVGFGEGYGWRGYLLRKLLPVGEVKAAVVVGAIWAPWHLPVLIAGLSYAGVAPLAAIATFISAGIAISVLFARVFLASGGAVLVMAACMAASTRLATS